MPIDRLKKGVRILVVLLLIEMVIIIVLSVYRMTLYNNAVSLYDNGDYTSAITLFQKVDILGDYKECKSYIRLCKNEIDYVKASELYSMGDYEGALEILMSLPDDEKYSDLYNNVINNQSTILQSLYDKAQKYMDEGNYDAAIKAFDEIGNYRDSYDKKNECLYRKKRVELGNTISAGTWSTAAIIGNNREGCIEINDLYRKKDAEEKISGWSDLVSISCTGYYAIGLTIDGSVLTQMVCQNATEYDMTNLEEIKNAVQIDTGTMFGAVLTSDKKVVTAGKYCHDNECLDVSDWDGIEQIATGRNFIAGLTTDGNLKIKGLNVDNLVSQYNAEKEEWTDIVKIVAGGGENNSDFYGGGHIVGLKSDGSVVAIGDNSFGQCNVKMDYIVKDIAAGDWHTCIVTVDDVIISVGSVDDIPAAPSNVDNKEIVSASAGYGYTIVLFKDGELKYRGYDYDNCIKTAIKWENIYVL